MALDLDQLEQAVMCAENAARHALTAGRCASARVEAGWSVLDDFGVGDSGGGEQHG
jgi:hypothetical protein